MKRKIVADGVYKDGTTGHFFIRPWIGRRRTWRKLRAVALRFAIEEARAKKTDQARAQVGTAKDPFAKAGTISEMAKLYLAAKCPNRRLEPRHAVFVTNERYRLNQLEPFFGPLPLNSIRMPLLNNYSDWRKRHRKRKHFTGERAIDLELVTLSNLLNYAVSLGLLTENPIRAGRPRFRRDADISHARERALPSSDDLHHMAHILFGWRKSESLGWLLLFSALTGCRNIELRGLRLDAKTQNDPGFVSGNYLFIRRAKGGVYPYVPIKDEMADLLDCFKQWREKVHPESPWFFPGRSGGQIDNCSLNHAMHRVCLKLDLKPCSPHGLRSFYVTKRRGDGIPDLQIAAEIGDKTVDLISRTYGDLPPNWTGRAKLSFLPTEGPPAWRRFIAENRRFKQSTGLKGGLTGNVTATEHAKTPTKWRVR